MKSFPFALGVLAAAGAAGAQSPATVAPAAGAQTIVVTGERERQLSRELGYSSRRQSAAGFGEQELLDTPFQVNVFSAELLRDQLARNLTDVARNEPAASSGDNAPGWYERLMLRGFYIGELYRDGLRINDQAQVPLDNKAAVEIVKGLSALRYGFSAPGGVVNYVVKRPLAKPLTRVTANVDSEGGHGLGLDLSRRLGASDEFGLRVNVVAEQERSYIDEVRGPRRFASVAFDWQISPALQLEIDSEVQRRRSPAGFGLYNGQFAPGVDERAAIDRFDPATFLGQTWALYSTLNRFHSLRLRWQAAQDWRVELALQAQRLHRDQNDPSPGFGSIQADGEAEVWLYFNPDQRRDSDSARLLVEGRLRQGGWQHQLAFGAEWRQAEASAGDGFYDIIGSTNIYAPRVVAQPQIVVPPSYVYGREREASLFIADTLTLSPHWQVFAGVRRVQPRFESFEASGARSGDAYRRGATTPSVGLVFKPDAATSVYTSYVEGLEGGGTAPDEPGVVNAREVLPPLRSHQIEIGFKRELVRGALLQAALFEIDKGLERFVPVPGGRLYVQDGRQVHRGAELTLSGQLTPAWRLVGGLAWLDARVRDSGDPALDGKRPQGVAKLQGSVHADWRFAEAWAASLSLFHSGRKAITADNGWYAGGATRIDAGLRWQQRLPEGGLVLRAAVQNLADRRYLENTAYGSYGFAPPRSLRASAEWTF
jgi:iron complex outermembrane receptor protein